MRAYKIVMLGPSTCGKTVYLASLFNRLRAASAANSFFLQPADLSQEARLSAIFAQIADVQKKWPAGNLLGDFMEWQFICQVEGRNGEHVPAAAFTYLDYAGEHLTSTERSESGKQTFESHLGNAHALVGMIDGYDVLQLMRGEMTEFDFDHKYDVPLSILYRADLAIPIHLVLTKWDLFQPSEWPEVRGILRNRSLVDAIATRQGRAGKAFRLIPVSSVGPSYVQKIVHSEETNRVEMLKRQDGHIEPVNVEMPLACILRDEVARQAKEVRELRREFREAYSQQLKHAGRITFRERLKWLFWSVTLGYARAQFHAIGILMSQTAFDEFEKDLMQRYRDRARQRVEDYKAKHQHEMDVVESEEQAFKKVEEQFKFLSDLLDVAFPGNALTITTSNR